MKARRRGNGKQHDDNGTANERVTVAWLTMAAMAAIFEQRCGRIAFWARSGRYFRCQIVASWQLPNPVRPPFWPHPPLPTYLMCMLRFSLPFASSFVRVGRVGTFQWNWSVKSGLPLPPTCLATYWNGDGVMRSVERSTVCTANVLFINLGPIIKYVCVN